MPLKLHQAVIIDFSWQYGSSCPVCCNIGLSAVILCIVMRVRHAMYDDTIHERHLIHAITTFDIVWPVNGQLAADNDDTFPCSCCPRPRIGCTAEVQRLQRHRSKMVLTARACQRVRIASCGTFSQLMPTVSRNLYWIPVLMHVLCAYMHCILEGVSRRYRGVGPWHVYTCLSHHQQPCSAQVDHDDCFLGSITQSNLDTSRNGKRMFPPMGGFSHNRMCLSKTLLR